MKWLGRFFVWLAGADYEVLLPYSHERAKYVGTGTGILITGVIAGLSMWFALTSALGVHVGVAVPLAVCWALVIMAIDRWLVATLKRQSTPSPGRPAAAGSGQGTPAAPDHEFWRQFLKFWRYVMAVAPRLLLAGVLGFVISTPITLRVFHKEIDFQLGLTQARALAVFLRSPARVDLEKTLAADRKRAASFAEGGSGTGADSALAGLEKTLAADKAQETQDLDTYQCELYGIPLPGGQKCPAGTGPVERAAKRAFDSDVISVRKDKEAIARERSSVGGAAVKALPAAQRQVTRVQRELDRQLATFNARNSASTGLLDQLSALGTASAARPALGVARWLLFFLFFLIDCLPALMAITLLLNPPDEYERAIAQGIKTREKISRRHLDDLRKDAKALSIARKQHRAETAKARAARLGTGGASAGPRRQRQGATGPGVPPVQGMRGQGMPRQGMPGPGTPQIFIRQYRPPNGAEGQSTQVPANGSTVRSP